MVTTLSSFRASGSGPTGEHAAPPAAVAYRERPPPAALAPWVRCTWELTVGQGADRDGLVLPDGCQDIVLLAGGLLVAGPDTGPAIGLGERQLRRRFLAAVGYGPKTLARILRFQRLLALLDGDPATRPSLALAAAEAGYADQAHMSAECVRLAARTPGALLLRPR